MICAGGEATGGVGGSGLFKSESVILREMGEGENCVASNSSNDTIWGVRELTSLPCRCFGAGGGFFFSVFFTSVTKPTLSSSDGAIS